jgi:uncharacterized Zn finger protein (UPF0148 family)
VSLPERCDTCNYPLFPWDDTEETRCGNCGSRVQPWELLTLPERQRRERLIQRRLEIDTATAVKIRGDVL